MVGCDGFLMEKLLPLLLLLVGITTVSTFQSSASGLSLRSTGHAAVCARSSARIGSLARQSAVFPLIMQVIIRHPPTPPVVESVRFDVFFGFKDVRVERAQLVWVWGRHDCSMHERTQERKLVLHCIPLAHSSLISPDDVLSRKLCAPPP